MPVTKSEVYNALILEQGGRVSAMRRLRDAGKSFTNTKFIEIANELEAEGFEEPTADETDEVQPIIGGQLEAPDETREWAEGDTFVFTSAQSNTHLNDAFFGALEAYCEARDAVLHISRYTYNKQAYGKKSVKPGTADSDAGLWFDPRIEPYVSDSPLQITDDLVWCGELNIIPTRQFPLTTLKSYTRQASGIVPHAKMQMESVPTMKGDPAKMLYTTGTVTLRNYIQKIAGQVAEFHHVFGALVVEIDREQGLWWARQLNADKDGTFYDLDMKWSKDGPVWDDLDARGMAGRNYAHRVEAITHGDIHFEKRDDAILEAVFKKGGIVDKLRPKEQHFHDSVDFTARNHHNIKDPHFLHQQYVQGRDRVADEFEEVTKWLVDHAYRHYSQHFIIVSNHDQAIEHWLRNSTAMYDPVNARFWHELNAYCYQQRDEGLKPHPFEFLMTQLLRERSTAGMYQWYVIQEDASHKICGDIEAGLHGHLGPNGARGNPKNLRTAGKANTAHTHTAGIVDGVYTAGVYGKLDMGYNKGLSSWSHSFIVTYQNGKRAICTIKGGRAWRDQ